MDCHLDIDRFDALYARAGQSGLSDAARLECFQALARLYRGDFLPKQSGNLWVVPLSARYHARYLDVVKRCAALLEKAGRFEEMTALCAGPAHWMSWMRSCIS